MWQKQMWQMITTGAVGVVVLAVAVLLILLVLKRGSASATDGRLSKINPVKWFFIVLFGWLLYSIGSCIYSLPRQFDETSRSIAKEGREWEEALYEIARKATSPAEKQQELPKEELEEAPSPLSRVEMVGWWMKHGRPRPADGWKETGTEVDFHANGELGLVPVINTTFWEGYQLKIRPVSGFDWGLGVSHLVDSRSSSADEATLRTLSSGSSEQVSPISCETGLVWLRTWLPYHPTAADRKPLEFTACITEPVGNSYVVRRKQGSVRFAYQRDFRPMAGAGQGLTARCCVLPFQMIGQATGKPVTVPVDFDIDVTLARLPKPGETTVTETRPNAQDLDKRLVVLELVDDDGTVLYERHINEWHVRLSSEKDIRPYLGDPKKYPYGELRFKCRMPVGVHVAIQIGGSRR